MARTWVALLRGVNVGGKNRLPMKSLREVLEGLGLEQPKTYIQSGNAVFRGPDEPGALAEQISRGIGEAVAFEPQVWLLTASDLEEALATCPFPLDENDGKAVHLGFLDATPPKPDLKGMEALAKPSERFELRGRVVFMYAPEGIGRSQLFAKAERLLGAAMTARNARSATMILKLAQSLS